MGMTNIQKELVRYVAENNLQKAKLAALGCCREDTTQEKRNFPDMSHINWGCLTCM